jgi:hypothetical protein
MGTSYFLQPCYYDRGQIGWASWHNEADFWIIYSGDPWGIYKAVSGWETPWDALGELSRLLPSERSVEVSGDFAPPFPANPKLEELTGE